MTEEGRGLILAIDAGGTFFKSALVAADGQIVCGSKLSCPADSDGPAELIQAAYQWLAGKQMEAAEHRNSRVAAIGIDTPGPFDYARGESRMRHKFRSIYGIPLRPWLEEIVGKVPIYFLHDSTAFLLGEHWKGRLRGCDDCAGVMIGTGLGFSYMKNGEVQLNDVGGPACSLYSRPYRDGTAEDFISRRGICRRYQNRVLDCPNGIDVIDIAKFAGAGDHAALETFEETGEMLGEILLPVLREQQCRRLVVGGQISKAYPFFGKVLEQVLEGAGLDQTGPSGNPDDAHLLGCASSGIGKIATEEQRT